jgi:hypothetical protein
MRRALLVAVLASSALVAAAGVAGAQEDPFVTSGPDQLGERVSESEQATRRLNLAVIGLVGLAGVIGASTIVFWRMSAPRVTTATMVRPAFRIEYSAPASAASPGPAGSAPPFAVPTIVEPAVAPAPATLSSSVATQAAAGTPLVSLEDVAPAAGAGGSWASQGWGEHEHG